MDNVVAVEESQWRYIDSPASASKSLGSPVHINSIAIDLNCTMEEIESPMHEHFSIRGFVAGMRKKDGKMCLPFASEAVSNDMVDDLPPLSVPKFRWWQCSNCVPEIAAERTALEMLADRTDAGTSSCQHADTEKDIVLFSHSILNIVDGHGLRESNDPSIIIKHSNPQYCKGQKATTSSKEKTDVRNNECGTSYSYKTEADPVRIGERHDNNADALDSVPIAHLVEPDNVSSGSDAVGCALLRRRKPKLRSLADIMEDENNSNGEHIKMRSALSSGTQATSTEKEDDSRHPELEASADASALTCLHKKRKSADEDRAKRFKAPLIDSDKRRRLLQVSDSESGGDGSAQSVVPLNAKTQQIKAKRNKALEINRKMKQTHSDNRTVLIREAPKINSILQENIQKHAASVETNCGSVEHVPPTLRGEVEPYLSSLLSGKQADRISDKSKSKRPIVEVELSPLIPPRKSFVGDCSGQEKVALDLSLNSYEDFERHSNNQISGRQHRSIPDLNESFTEKSPPTQWKQLLTPEDRCSTLLHKKLDTAGEGKRQFEVSEPQAVHKILNNIESGGTSDDIPMDIVELLAKNQQERTLENSRNHLHTSTSNSSIRRSPASYVHPITPEMGSIFSFPVRDARSAVGVASSETRLSQGLINFPRQMDVSKLEENQFRLFGSSYKPCQPKNTQYSGPRPREKADLLWAPRIKNALHLDVRQTVSNMEWDVRKVACDASSVKEGRVGPSTKSAGSLDPYSNDTIPAMQLLSLMDRGIVSGSSFKVGSNQFLDKTFSPCNHHPRPNEKKSDPFINGSLFSQGSHPGMLNGVRFPGESSKKLPFAPGRMPPPRGSTKALNLDSPANLAVHPSRVIAETEICTLNRNPADFSIPDAKNEFTRSARDLKSRKYNPLKERPRAVNLEGQKRGRVRKDASGK